MIDEVEVYVSSNDLGRAAIVRRPDGHFCIYVHWLWSKSNLTERGVVEIHPGWDRDETALDVLYEDVDPLPGIYGTIEDARREIFSRRGFSDAHMKRGRQSAD